MKDETSATAPSWQFDEPSHTGKDFASPEVVAAYDARHRRFRDVDRENDDIIAALGLLQHHTVADFGCGTGLVTLELASQVGSITGADTSPGMLKTLEEKAVVQGTPVRLIHLDTAGTGDLGGPYDLIVSSMTLHHVADVPSLFRQLTRHLRPGGRVALADLDEEDGSFHDASMAIFHRGFSREQIQSWLKDAGFQEIHMETATVTQKEGKDYPVFLASAERS